jgi:hypothetical protein
MFTGNRAFKAGESSSNGYQRVLEKDRAKFSDGINHKTGEGSLSIAHPSPAISVVVLLV